MYMYMYILIYTYIYIPFESMQLTSVTCKKETTSFILNLLTLSFSVKSHYLLSTFSGSGTLLQALNTLTFIIQLLCHFLCKEVRIRQTEMK